MPDFRTGDKVICQDDSASGRSYLVRGREYTVYALPSDTRKIIIDAGDDYPRSRNEEWFKRRFTIAPVKRFDLTADVSRQFCVESHAQVLSLAYFNDGSDYPLGVKYHPAGPIHQFSIEGISQDGAATLETKPEPKPIAVSYLHYRFDDGRIKVTQHDVQPRSDSSTWRIECLTFDPNKADCEALTTKKI